MQKLSSNIYVEIAFKGANVGFVTTSEGIVMIETPQVPVDAVKWRDEIAKHGEVKYLIHTEPHGDHISGDFFFGGTVVGHEGTRAAVLATNLEQHIARLKQMSPESAPLLNNYHFRPPTITFSKQMTLYAGKHTFKLMNFPGHTAHETTVFIPEERVVFTGDNVVNSESPYLFDSLPFEWLESLKKIGELDVDKIVPGHGEVCDKTYLPVIARMIQERIDIVAAAIKKGMTLEEAQKNVVLPGASAQMAPMANRNVTRLYEAIKKRESSKY